MIKKIIKITEDENVEQFKKGMRKLGKKYGNPYYDKYGRNISSEKWAKLFEDYEYKVIKRDTLSNGILISTVWLGLDHGFSGKKPIIFETMAFAKKEKTIKFGKQKVKIHNELEMDRYSTITEAKKGHKKMVDKWSKK